ncbi:MAG TPA: FAD-binding oxidoreductase [Methylomirabilota bacterium]|nr:FAD-binding oxidoreductase [Methylomirabilota bacterium]
MRATADVVIVGGGVTGTSIAFHLAQAGVREVIVLERRFLGAGGTGRSVGIIRQLYPTAEATGLVLRSLDVYRHFDEAVGGDSGYVGCGALIGVGSSMRSQLEATLALQRPLGVRAELLTPADAVRIEPRIDPSSLAGVVYEPDSGYADPSAVTLAYAAAARRLGVAVEQGVEVAKILTQADRVTGVATTSGAVVTAPVVVNATGLWSPRLASLVGIELPIVIGRHPVFIVERDPGFGPPHPVFLDLAGGTYVRPETGGLTLTGSLTDDETRHPMDPDLLGSEAGFAEAAQALERTSRAVPRLAEARYRQGYAGAFDITPDWMPILDQSPLGGFWIAAGMSGHGFKLAPAIGEMMAALITGLSSPVSPVPFRLDRFAAARAGTFVSSYLR